jgi:hypothetical protein
MSLGAVAPTGYLMPDTAITAVAATQQAAGHGLPEPLLTSRSPTDLLGMMLALTESMNTASANQTEQQIRNNQAKLSQALDDFNAKMTEALHKAQAAQTKHDNGDGLFGFIGDALDAVCDFVADVIGTVVGTVVDFVYDIALAPLDLIKGLLEHQSLRQILESRGEAFTHNGGVAKTIDECAHGVMQFVADLVKFAATALAVVEAGLTGHDIGQALKSQCQGVLDSLKENILDNAAVMKVVGVVLKVVAVAASTVSCGVLAPIAVGLFILSELDQHIGLAKAIFKDEKTAAWVSLGVKLAAAVCMAAAGGGGGLSGVAGAVADAAVIVSAVSAGVQAARTFAEQNRVADNVDHQAETQDIMNRMSRLQRVIDTLLEELGNHVDDRERTFKDGAQLYRTEGATLEAAVVRG